MKSARSVVALALVLVLSASVAEAEYLSDADGITVSVGPASVGSFVNLSEAQSLANVIDLDAANLPDFHTQSSHVWWSGGPLELVFNFQDEYDLTTLHFWNYFTEAFDVDNILLTFFDASNTNSGSVSVTPATGGPGGANEQIDPQDIPLAVSNVQFVSAVLTSTSTSLDFNNLGFTGELSPDDNGPGPGPGPTPVPEPGTLSLLALGLLLAPAMGVARRGERRQRNRATGATSRPVMRSPTM